MILLVLAFLFLLPGLPPFGVDVPMANLLIYPPWHSYYANITPYVHGGDVVLQQLPWHDWVREELLSGRFPLWASGPLGGVPLFSHAQSAALYPLHILWAFLPTGAGLGIVMALKAWLAGWGTWGFLRALRLHPLAALVGALGFMFSASFVVWLPWDNSGIQLLLPWLCWAAYVWCMEGKRGALVGVALLTAFAVVGGNPEILAIVGLTAAIWTISLLVSGARSLRFGQIGALAAAVGVGVLLGAIQILPFLEALGISSLARRRDLAGTLAPVHMDASMLMDWLLPRWWGAYSDGVLGGPMVFTEANGYVGLVALVGLLLALLGVARKQINLQFVLPFLFIGVFAFLVTYDDTIGRAIRSLPILSQMIGYRWIQSVSFSLVVLGALGWDWLIKRAGALRASAPAVLPMWAGLKWLGAGLLTVGAVVLVAHLVGLVPYPVRNIPGVLLPPTDDYRLYWAVWSGALLLCIGGLLVLCLARPEWRRVIGLGLAVLVITDLWRLLYTYNQTAPPDEYYPRTSFIDQTASLVPPTDRLLVIGDVMPANSGLILGLRDWRSNDPMLSVRSRSAAQLLSPEYVNDIYTDYNMILSHVRLQVGPAFGMRYYILPTTINPNTPADDTPDKPAFTRLAFKDGLGLWEAEGVPGFAYLSDAVTAVPSERDAYAWMEKLTWTQMRSYSAMVEAPATAVSSIAHDPQGTSPGSVNVSEYTPGHIVLSVDALRAGLAVVAESYYPGWQATVDGQPVQILRTNYISQGIVVPEGKHTIEMKYEPDSFRNGAFLSLAGVVGLAGLIFWWRKGKRA